MPHDDPGQPRHQHPVVQMVEVELPEESVSSFEGSRGISALITTGLGCSKAILHVDPIAGAAGDMLLAALLDAGASRAWVDEAIASLGLPGVELVVGIRERHAISALGVEVQVHTAQPPRTYSVIKDLLDHATSVGQQTETGVQRLEPRVHELAQHAFLRLGEAEAKVHRQPLSTVHFHEVGSVDAIVDIVAVSAAVASIEAAEGGPGTLGFSLGPLPFGGGRAHGAHGVIPVPAPATLELLAGLPVQDARFSPGQEMELVTPTGAALLRTFAERLPSHLGSWPSFRPRTIGYGSGRRKLTDRPNVVRVVLGDRSVPSDSNFTGGEALRAKELTVLEANIDDATGEVLGATLDTLMASGALDVWVSAITMKKNRPATTVSVLTTGEQAEVMAGRLMAESGSLGVRVTRVIRYERPRRFESVQTAFGLVRIKIADGDGLEPVYHPELEDCRSLANTSGVPVRKIIAAALEALRLRP